MAESSGAKSRRRGPFSGPLLLGGAVILVLGLAAGGFLASRWAQAEQLSHWALAGEPCPAVTEQTYRLTAPSNPRTLTVDALSATCGSGFANCSAIPDPAGGSAKSAACQFKGPHLVLPVTLAGRTAYYEPQSRPATVFLKGGQLNCVIRPSSTTDVRRARRAWNALVWARDEIPTSSLTGALAA